MTTTLHLGTRKGFFSVERTGKGWAIVRSSFLGVHVPMLLPDTRDGTLYAVLEHGHFGTKVHASRDGGVTWEERGCPAYPPKPEGTPDIIDPMRQKAIPWSLEKIWSLEAGGIDQPGMLWCGTLPGGLFQSTDSGANWSLVESLWNRPERAQMFGGGYDWPGIHSICVDPRDSQRIVIAISCGGVWETLDGGKNWACHGEGIVNDYMPPEQAQNPVAQDPHRIACCQRAPDTIWMQHHNGIFRTDDGGKKWRRFENAKPSVFGFAVAVHPHDPDTAWFVPAIKDENRTPPDAALSVMRTRDGGKTFEACRNGLPQSHAYHLAYRHGLDVTGDGCTLAFASTTGGVWVSEDSGDKWQQIAADLPPVYCLRFAEA